MKFEKITKKYILKNKNIPVLTFDYEKINKEVYNAVYSTYKLKHIEILNETLLPKSYPKEKYNTAELKKWIEHRKAPKNRKNINNLINYEIQKLRLDSNNFMNFIDISYGLSLNDSYWIVPDDGNEYKWENYNLYNNKFSEKLGLIAFGEKGIADSLNEKFQTSPEYTTNGMLAKCWTMLNDEIVLLKKSSEHYKVEAMAEYYMCQVADIMGFNHIDYDIIKYHNSIVSSCKLFTTEDIGYSPISNFITIRETISTNPEKLIEKVEKIVGKEFLEDLMVFDSLIYNNDRHFGNYGMLVNNDTGEILTPAPIFDNGNSVLMLYSDLPSECTEIFANHKLGIPFDVLSSNFVQERHKEGLEKLKDFKFKRHKEYNLSEDLLKKGENFISKRAETILKQLDNKLEKVFLNENEDKKKLKIEKEQPKREKRSRIRSKVNER